MEAIILAYLTLVRTGHDLAPRGSGTVTFGFEGFENGERNAQNPRNPVDRVAANR
jgi:hypothetical protein